jgi:hypothetical protein
VQLRGCRVRVSIVLQLRVAPSFSKHASTIDGFHPHEKQMEYSGQEEWFTECVRSAARSIARRDAALHGVTQHCTAWNHLLLAVQICVGADV